MKIPSGLRTALAAVALGVFALVYFTSALHALVARDWLSAGFCAPTAVVYGWAFLRAFRSLAPPGKEKNDDAPR